MSSPTHRSRAQYDRKRFYEFVTRNHRHIQVEKWRPASVDLVVTNVPGVTGLDGDGRPTVADEHRVRIVLPPDYPNEAPSLVPLSPLWHPNISKSSACLWTEYDPTWSDVWAYMLRQFVAMIQYRLVNLDMPHRDQNPNASKWLEEVRERGGFDGPLKPMIHLR